MADRLLAIATSREALRDLQRRRVRISAALEALNGDPSPARARALEATALWVLGDLVAGSEADALDLTDADCWRATGEDQIAARSVAQRALELIGFKIAQHQAILRAMIVAGPSRPGRPSLVLVRRRPLRRSVQGCGRPRGSRRRVAAARAGPDDSDGPAAPPRLALLLGAGARGEGT